MKAMSKSSPVKADFQLPSGAFIEIKGGFDLNGLPVISELNIFFANRSGQKIREDLPTGGISQKLLREIDLSLAINQEFSKPGVKSNLTISEKQVLIKSVRSGFERSGRTPTPIKSYAALSRLYVEACKTHPRNPTQYLTELFDIQSPAMNRRLSRAKELGLLTTQKSINPSGKAGAKMSDICETLVNEILEGIK